MKKNVFFFAMSAILFLSGLAFSACDDDDDNSEPTPTTGKKTIDLRVSDETGALTTANVSITKDGTLVNTILVAGSYTLDVTNDKSGTTYIFKASRQGYVDSGTQTVQVTYADATESFSSYVVLQITKQSTTLTLNPNVDNSFSLPSSTVPGEDIEVLIPAGTFDKTVTLTPTVLPTTRTRGVFEADAPNRSVALQIINLQSNWEGPFLNNEKVNVTFPLSQDVIDYAVNKGIGLVFGTSSTGTWESFPVIVNTTNRTGTVSIPHFSTWYLTTTLSIDINITQTPLETLGTGTCGSDLTVTYTKENAPVPEFYQKVFGWTTFPTVSQSNTEIGVDGKYWLVRGRSIQKSIVVEGVNSIVPNYTYYEGPVTFSSTPLDCSHSGGGGQ